MSIVSPRCLLDAVRQSGLLVEAVLPIFAISSGLRVTRTVRVGLLGLSFSSESMLVRELVVEHRDE